MLTLSLLFAGCGGGGGAGGEGGAASRTVSGYASKGIIKSGTVSLYALGTDGLRGAKLAGTTTDSSGYYSASVGSYYGPLSVEVFGSYTDEATGVTASVLATAPLKAATVPPVDATPVIVNISALTEIAYTKAQTMSGGLTANIVATNTLVSKSFLVDNILTTRPMDASAVIPVSATDFERQYTLVLAAVSQYAMSNLPAGTVTATALQLSAALTTALADLKAQLPANSTLSALTLQTIVADAAFAFLTNTNNHTGITQNDASVKDVLAARRTVSGYASKGIIKNGTVNIYALSADGSRGAKLFTSTTNNVGYYSVTIGNYYGPISVEVFGNYTDEATGKAASIPESAPLKAATVPPADATPVTVNVTALTEIAYIQAVSQPKSFTANINAINQQVSSSFNVPDILTTIPLDTSVPLPTTATAGEKQYTLVLAAVSQLASNNLLPASATAPTPVELSVALTAAINTLQVQVASGSGGATTVQSSIAAAATEFLADTTNNKSGLTAADPAIQVIVAWKSVTVTIAVKSALSPVPTFAAVRGSLTVPSGVSCSADPVTGEIQSGVLQTLKAGAYVGGNFRAGTNTLTVNILSASTPLVVGNLLTVTCSAPTAMSVLKGNFIVNNASIDVNDGGYSLSGFTLEVTDVK